MKIQKSIFTLILASAGMLVIITSCNKEEIVPQEGVDFFRCGDDLTEGSTDDNQDIFICYGDEKN